MRTPEYTAKETEILGLLKSPTFSAHHKQWSQKQNIWQFAVYGHMRINRDTWNIRVCTNCLRQACRPGCWPRAQTLLDEIYHDAATARHQEKNTPLSSPISSIC